MKFYAVKEGKVTGIYTSWPECEKKVKGFKNCKYKSFESKIKALAYMNGTDDKSQLIKKNKGIDKYFLAC